MESLVQGQLARRVRWGGCRNVRSEKIVTRCVLTQSMRERLATFTRKCHHAARRLKALHTGMYLIGCTYNFCWPHHELGKHHEGTVVTPAMAAGLTDHVWSPLELLSYKVAPAPWVAAKRRRHPRKGLESKALLPKRPRGRPRTRPLPDHMTPKRPRGRPRKVALAASTS